MPKWEYRVEDLNMSSRPRSSTELFNQLGDEGWELCGVRPVITSVGSQWDWLAIFKRPKE